MCSLSLVSAILLAVVSYKHIGSSKNFEIWQKNVSIILALCGFMCVWMSKCHQVLFTLKCQELEKKEVGVIIYLYQKKSNFCHLFGVYCGKIG